MRKLLWLAAAAAPLAVALAGCRSAPEAAGAAPAPPADQGKGWFCEMGEQEDEWACVRSAGLGGAAAATHRHAGAELSPPASAQHRLPRPPAAAPAPAPGATRTPQTAPAPGAASAAAAASADLPLYQRLAYRPDVAVRLDALPAEFFVVQLIAVGTRQALEEHVAAKRLANMTATRVERDGELFYVLLLGIYEDRPRADRAAASLPPEFEGFEPWVRSLGSLQEAMARGNALAGTDVI